MPASAKNRLLHDLPAITVRSRSVSKMDNNVYVITSKATGAQVLIDAAANADGIRALLASADQDTPAETWVAAIVTTHRHRDHLRALAEIAGEQVEARLCAGAADVEAIEEQAGVHIDVPLEDGGTVVVDDIRLGVIGLRGHTPGSVALAYEAADGPALLFTGDSLFPGGVGNTEQDAERFQSLLADVTERLFGAYADDAVVHPGHGASTTLGAERPHLKEWAERGW